MVGTKNQNTEEIIKEAARKVFMQKGFSATKTRDIADESGVNLALINYYFRSKKKLFQIIMKEKLSQIDLILTSIMFDEKTSLDEKIDLIIDDYMDALIKQPDLPIFILNEVHTNPTNYVNEFNLKDGLSNSSFMLQLMKQQPDINPIQIFLSLIGMIAFPFMAKPMIEVAVGINKEQFSAFSNERKELLKKWMKTIIFDK